MSISQARSMRNDKQQMSLLRIVQRLWGHVYDLLFLVKGTGKKDLETIEMELDLTEYYCRPYAQDDEDSGASAADADGSDGVDAAGSGDAGTADKYIEENQYFY